MTLDEVLEHLARTPRTWQVTICGSIRTGCDCPLTAVYNMLHPGPDPLISEQFEKAARWLRVRDEDRDRIVEVADYAPIEEDRLRVRVMRACGLERKCRVRSAECRVGETEGDPPSLKSSCGGQGDKKGSE